MPLNLVRRGGGLLRNLPVNGAFAQPVRVVSSQHQVRRIAFVACRSSPTTVASRLSNPSSLVGNLVRSYATKEGSTTKTKRRTTATKKPATKAKKPAKKPAKRAAKKPAPKRPTRKPLTEKQVEARNVQKRRDEVKELKVTALELPKQAPHSWFVLALTDQYNALDKAAYPVHQDAFKKASALATALGPDERQRYVDQAKTGKAASLKDYKAFVESHTPLQIYEANKARRRLRVLLNKQRLPLIKDDRLVKRPITPFFVFRNEHWDKTGDIADQAQALGSEWRNLSQSEKEKYVKMAKDDVERYRREHLNVYGFEPPFLPREV